MKNKEFLQSEEWRKFQEVTGKRTFHIEHDGFWVNIVEHKLPIVSRYFYVPRGDFSEDLINLAKKEKAGWIRVDVENEENLKSIEKSLSAIGGFRGGKIVKAPHDMQPKEIFLIDITKLEKELLNEMKPKTRYNIKLAEKKNVKVTGHWSLVTDKNKCVNEFLRLVKVTAERKGVKFHPENYYRKMIETIDSDILSLYCAEYNNKVIAANLVVFYGDTAIYLHGATDDEYRNVMAPYLLQWQAILDAKQKGCKFYDFGGVKIGDKNNWSGITKFKLGFSQVTKPIEFLGSYDIVVSLVRYRVYRIMQKVKSFVR